MFPQSFPPADHLFRFLASRDYKQLRSNVITGTATFCAFTVALSVFVYSNARKFWAEHGETIQFYFALFIEKLEDSIQVVYDAGANFRPVFNRYANILIDSIYQEATNDQSNTRIAIAFIQTLRLKPSYV
jgi:hypothetical protein